jgi:hypothetical protein
MRVRVSIAALAAFLVAVTVAAGASGKPAPPTAGQSAVPTDVRAAFFTNWSRYARGYTVKQIPADKLNVVDYAFGSPTAAGTCGLTDPWSDYEAPTGADQSVDGIADDSANPNQHLYGNFNQLLKLKAAHPNLRVVMSLGGWTGSKYFSDVAATAATRQAFVASCVDLLLKGNLPADPATIWPPAAGGPAAIDTIHVTPGAQPLFYRRGPTTVNRQLPTADLRFTRADRVHLELPAGPTDKPGTGRMLDRNGQPLAVPVTRASASWGMVSSGRASRLACAV